MKPDAVVEGSNGQVLAGGCRRTMRRAGSARKPIIGHEGEETSVVRRIHDALRRCHAKPVGTRQIIRRTEENPLGIGEPQFNREDRVKLFMSRDDLLWQSIDMCPDELQYRRQVLWKRHLGRIALLVSEARLRIVERAEQVKDSLSGLTGEHAARGKPATIAHHLDLIIDRLGNCTGFEKISRTSVRQPGDHGALRRRERLRQRLSPENGFLIIALAVSAAKASIRHLLQIQKRARGCQDGVTTRPGRPDSPRAYSATLSWMN